MMDELEVVRRMGADEAEPDPDARERVRARVVTGRRRRPRWSVALVPAGAVALGVALVVALGGGAPDREFAGGPTTTASTTPAPGPGPAPNLFPAPDEFLYVRSRTRYQACDVGAGVERCRMQTERIREVWMSERRPSRLRTTPSGGEPSKLGRVSLMIGNHRFTHAALARYRPTPRALLDMLVRERPRGQGGASRSYPFTQITDALREVPMPVAARRALVGALTLVPGVTEDGDVRDTEGRSGVQLSRLAPGGRGEIAIVDPVRLVLLEERTLDADGDTVGLATYLERAVTVDTKRP